MGAVEQSAFSCRELYSVQFPAAQDRPSLDGVYPIHVIVNCTVGAW